MRRLAAALLITVLTGGGLAACGGGDDDDQGGDVGVQATEPDGGDGDTGGGGNTTDGTEPEGDDDGEGDDTTDDTTGNAELDELIARSRSAEVKVTYPTNGDSLMTLAQSPPRSSVLTDGNLMIDDGEGTLVQCSGVDTESPQCTEIPIAGDMVGQMLTGFFGVFAAAIITGIGEDTGLFSGAVETSEEEIVGRDAICTTFDLSKTMIPGATGSMEYCIDSETGMMLRSRSEGDSGTDEIIAVEFGEPEDSDFEPPAPPATVPGLDDIDIPGMTPPTDG